VHNSLVGVKPRSCWNCQPLFVRASPVISLQLPEREATTLGRTSCSNSPRRRRRYSSATPSLPLPCSPSSSLVLLPGLGRPLPSGLRQNGGAAAEGDWEAETVFDDGKKCSLASLDDVAEMERLGNLRRRPFDFPFFFAGASPFWFPQAPTHQKERKKLNWMAEQEGSHFNCLHSSLKEKPILAERIYRGRAWLALCHEQQWFFSLQPTLVGWTCPSMWPISYSSSVGTSPIPCGWFHVLPN
jgi:hypothetical protein